ncbi:MAG: hypothetical protein HQL76_14935 [Magnetococcales bacterium]|nr:hypothetical protein [Magnetococcales bacterium]
MDDFWRDHPRDTGDWTQLAEWFKQLTREVADLLGLSVAGIRLNLRANQSGIAYTRYGNTVPEINLSPDTLYRDIVAHEICHALLPVRALFLAEGMASYVGYRMMGNCHHFLFPQETISQLLHDYQEKLPPLSGFLHQKIGSDGFLSLEKFATLQGRLAHGVAASFAEFCLDRYPGFAPGLQKHGDGNLDTLLQKITGKKTDLILAAWQRHIGLEGYVMTQESTGY